MAQVQGESTWTWRWHKVSSARADLPGCHASLHTTWMLADFVQFCCLELHP